MLKYISHVLFSRTKSVRVYFEYCIFIPECVKTTRIIEEFVMNITLFGKVKLELDRLQGFCRFNLSCGGLMATDDYSERSVIFDPDSSDQPLNT